MGAFDRGYGQALIDATGSPATRAPSGFLENFAITFEATRQEDLSISERRNLLRKREERRRTIIELTGEDTEALRLEAQRLRSRPSAVFSGKQELAEQAYHERISELAARYPEVLTDEEIELDIIEESRRLREQEAQVSAHATGMGNVGSFTGAMAATMTDPLVLGSMLFGASTSAGILKTALTEAGIGAVSEAAIQPFVYRYKQKLGSPFGVGEAAGNVALAAIGGAVLGGAVKAGAKGVERLTRPRVTGVDDLMEEFDRVVANKTVEQADAMSVLQDLADVSRETPFDPADPIADRVHIEAASKALADAEAGNPIDVQPIVRGQEPRAEVGRELPKRLPGAERTTPPTDNQSLRQFVKNSGGVSVEKAGALRGEYDALYEGKGRTSGAVKRKAGLSPDAMAQRAHEAGFIDDADPATLAEALARDLSGQDVFSVQGERFQRRMDLELDRDYERWAEMKEAEYLEELEQFDVEGIDIPIAEGIEEGEAFAVLRPAREVLDEADADIKAGELIVKCLLKG